MKAITQPFGMQSSAEVDFRTRALLSHAGHSSAFDAGHFQSSFLREPYPA